MVGHSGNYYNQAYIPLLPPLLRTASANSASVDVQNYDALALLVNVGGTGDTLNGTNRVELQVQESDDNTTFTPVADADLLSATPGQAAGTFGVVNNATTAVNRVYLTGYRGNRRHVRVALANFGTTATGTYMDVLALGGRPRSLPVNA